MKLKKIASLALVGVMAVSMLAGCGNKTNKPTEDPDVVTSGYSADFGKIADLDKDYVTFKDSTVDQTALQAAVDSCTDVQLYGALVVGNIPDLGAGILQGAMAIPSDLNLNCTTVFAKEADLDKYQSTIDKGNIVANIDFAKDKNLNVTQKVGVIVAVDGTMDTQSVLKQVNKIVNKGLKGLEESGTADSVIYDYHYTVSISVVSRTTTMSDAIKADMDFVAVTVTRTGTDRAAA